MGDSSCTIAPVCSHKLTATYDSDGCTAPSVSEFLESGASKTLTAVLKTNDVKNTYKFNGWSGDSSSSNQSIDVKMADKSLSYLANCSNNPLPFITVSHDGTCESVSGGGQLSDTSGSKDISATPVAHGSFIRWTTNCDSIADPSSPSTSASTDHDCKAVATCGSAPTHTLYVSYIDSAAGTVTPSSVPGLTQDSQYSPISTKLASSDYRLSTTQTQWVADTCTLNSASGDSNSLKAMGDSDCHVKIATNKKHLLTVKVDNADVLAALTDGSGANLVAASAPPVSTKLFVNDKANISLSLSSAAISADKALNNMSDWDYYGDTCSVTGDGKVTMGDSDCTVSITGVESPKNLHKLTVTPMPSAGGNPYIGTIGTTVAYFNQGDSASITTNPNSGYKVDSASASGCASGPTLASDNSSASITMAATDCNVTINYAANIKYYTIIATDTWDSSETTATRSVSMDAPSGTKYIDEGRTDITYERNHEYSYSTEYFTISDGSSWTIDNYSGGNDDDNERHSTTLDSYTLTTADGKSYSGSITGWFPESFTITTNSAVYTIIHKDVVQAAPTYTLSVVCPTLSNYWNEVACKSVSPTAVSSMKPGQSQTISYSINSPFPDNGITVSGTGCKVSGKTVTIGNGDCTAYINTYWPDPGMPSYSIYSSYGVIGTLSMTFQRQNNVGTSQAPVYTITQTGYYCNGGHTMTFSVYSGDCVLQGRSIFMRHGSCHIVGNCDGK